MRRHPLIAITAIALLSIGASAVAQAPVSISLTPPATLARDACPTPVWKDVSFIWTGVTDKRPTPEIGTQTQKGKDSIPVVAEPALTEVFGTALRQLLTSCGMTLLEKGKDDAATLSAEIREFSTGVEKKLLTGKSQAKASIAFTSRRGGRSSSVIVGYEIDAKKIRSGNIKQLQQTSNELLTEILKQIPSTPEMREIK